MATCNIGRLQCSWSVTTSHLITVFLVSSLLSVQNGAASVIRHKRQTDQEQELGQIQDIQTLLDPLNEVDLILMIDSSKGQGKSAFYTQEKPILEALVRQYALIHPDRVRLAAITFAIRTDTVFDYISTGSTGAINKCELFNGGWDSIWGTIQYFDEPEDNQRTEMILGLNTAAQIFSQGKVHRPNAKQILLIASDVDIQNTEYLLTKEKAEELHASGILVFVIGTGTWVKPGNGAVIASPDYFAFRQAWESMLLKMQPLTTYGPEDPFMFQDLPLNTSYCGSCRDQSSCYCNPYSGNPVCKCNKGHTYVKSGEQELCSPCAFHEFKDTVGDQPCTNCAPPSYTDSTGAVDSSQCLCPDTYTCEAECVPNPCSDKSYCNHASVQNHQCLCTDGWEDVYSHPENSLPMNVSCTRRIMSECDTNNCLNGGSCVDMDGGYSCVCPFGYTGERCEALMDMCQINFCQNGATCNSKQNAFDCDCAYGFKGTYCDQIGDTTPPPTTTTASTTTQSTTAMPTTTTESTTTPTTTTPEPTTTAPEPTTTTTPETTSTVTTPTPQPVSDDDKTMMYIIIGASAGGGLLLIILIIVIICCCCCRKQKEEEKPPVVDANGKSDGARLYRKNRSAKQTMSNRFSDFWRKKTMRPGSFFFNETKGVPSVPIRRRPDLAGMQDGQDGFSTLQSDNTVEYAVMDNQQIQDTGGMDGWMQYVNEIQGNKLVERACILKVSGKKRACSSNWDYDGGEIDKVLIVMENQDANVPAVIQRGEYHIHENDGTIATGKTIGSDQEAKVIAIGKTKTFLIIGIADASTDNGLCLKEIQWMTDHIKTEGY